jgi:hypothetical protein
MMHICLWLIGHVLLIESPDVSVNAGKDLSPTCQRGAARPPPPSSDKQRLPSPVRANAPSPLCPPLERRFKSILTLPDLKTIIAHALATLYKPGWVL